MTNHLEAAFPTVTHDYIPAVCEPEEADFLAFQRAREADGSQAGRSWTLDGCLKIKGSFEGKTYIGPGPEPHGQADREVESFDGRVLVLKWVDPEVAGRYGTMVLVRCGAEGTTKTKRAT